MSGSAKRGATGDATAHRRGGQRTRAAELLAEGASPVELAEALGVSRTTGWRLAQEPEVRSAVNTIRELRAGAAALRIEYVAARAVRVLDDLLDDREAPAAVRLRAACELLDRAGYGYAERSVSARVERELMGLLDTLKAIVDAPTYVEILRALAPGTDSLDG